MLDEAKELEQGDRPVRAHGSIKCVNGDPQNALAFTGGGEQLKPSQRAKELMANNGSLMSNTDKCLLHMARAMVMNPEILVLHKPLQQFDNAHARKVLQLLREFV